MKKFEGPLSKITYMHIGGKYDQCYEVYNVEDFIKFIKKTNQNYIFLGHCSNIVLPDIIKKGIIFLNKIKDLEINKNTIEIGSGTPLSQLVKLALEKGFADYENFAGIPASIGGAIYGNAGIPDYEIGNFIKEVYVWDKTQKKDYVLNHKDYKFTYRDSLFKKTDNYIILKAIFNIKQGNKKYMKEKFDNIIINRKGKQPYGYSCGSFYKNIKIDIKNINKYNINLDEIEKFKKEDFYLIPAGWIIDSLNLKGYKIKGIFISDMHANFIMNDGTGNYQNILDMDKFIKEKVYKIYKISLQREVIIYDKNLEKIKD